MVIGSALACQIEDACTDPLGPVKLTPLATESDLNFFVQRPLTEFIDGENPL